MADVDQMVKVYIKIRDKRAAIKAEYEDQDNSLKAKLEKIESALLAHCKANNTESVRTTHGTFTRTVRKRFWCNDWPGMYDYILENEQPEFFEKRLSQKAVEQYLEEHPKAVIPGLNTDSEYKVTVRRAR